jgi:lipopolysaccharide transport system permease protein
MLGLATKRNNFKGTFILRELKVTIYEPNYRQKMGFFSVWFFMFRNIVESRDLIIQLFKRDFFAVYKKSFLGLAWLLIGPIIAVSSWIFMSTAGILQPGEVGIPYPAYVLFSTFIWSVFTGFCTAAVGTLSSGSGFILQVKYPHETLLVKQAAQHIANTLISLVVNIGVMLLLGVSLRWELLLFPVLIIPLFFVGAGLGLLVAVLGVVSSEIQKIFDVFLGLLILITPVVYSSKINNPTVQEILKWNPLTYLVGGIRDLMLYGSLKYPERFALTTGLSVLFFLFSWRIFFLSEEKVIEKIL